jgi:4-amino-4-deoxy-L-arabinose transferase-like glycosyltransferase
LLKKGFLGISRQPWALIVLLLGFCFIFYFLNLGRFELRGSDENRSTQIARDIVEGGDWISMHYYGQRYWDKPPLFFWTIALSSYLWQGFSSFSARFPSAFFGTFTVLLAFLIGKGLYDSKTGFLSGLVLATSLAFARFSTRTYIDSPLTFFTTASFFCFLQWYRTIEEGAERLRRRGRLFLLGFYVSMALATLTKGPVGFLIPLAVTLVYLLMQKDWKRIKRMDLLRGMALFLVIVFFWYLPMLLKGGLPYLHETLSHQSIEYYATGWDHPKPFYFYFVNFPADFLPWFLFLPGALLYGYSNESFGNRKGFLFLLTWFVLPFLFFSFSGAKRIQYLLPLFPATSLMVGKLWGDFISDQMGPFQQNWIRIPLYGFMGLGWVVGAIVYLAASERVPSYLPYTLLVTVFLMGGSVALFFLYRSKRYGIIFFLIVGMAAVAFFYTENFLFYLDGQLKSARFVLRLIGKEIGLISP